ncbi:hypothetical protein BKP35_07700 [Anaerobacillus arseniciselenatis]|uniref:Uncharacterized protein n=1 Tax=Anaerobacillus arseniciselenatis TaxID=85682 RepID=A0A1S2LQW4_9BACI|nr:hypothetical protein [Anaerobacillus arseniciselenatis]OIJ14077.1 hypothetical protein BKP35_07700 [Anaerobacillus arseniciselenatis]
MFENQIKNALMNKPFLIEEGLKFKGITMFLKDDICDLKFEDRYGNDLYVLFKKEIEDSQIGRLFRYYSHVSKPNARFMLVGFSFIEGVKEALLDWEFEYKQLNVEEVQAVIENLQNRGTSTKQLIVG